MNTDENPTQAGRSLGPLAIAIVFGILVVLGSVIYRRGINDTPPKEPVPKIQNR